MCRRDVKDFAMVVSAWSVTNVFHLLSDILLRGCRSRCHGLKATAVLSCSWTSDTRGRGDGSIVSSAEITLLGDSPTGLLHKLVGRGNSGQFFKSNARHHTEPDMFSRYSIWCEAGGYRAWLCTQRRTPRRPRSPVLDPGSRGAVRVVRLGMERRRWLGLPSLELKISRKSKRLITLIQRASTRVLHMDEIASVALDVSSRSGNFTVDVVQLERLPFTRQQELFSRTAVLVGVHGQGLANVALLPPSSTVLIVMPREFFGLHFTYANLALEVGVHPIVLAGSGPRPLDVMASWDGRTETDWSATFGTKTLRLQPSLFRAAVEKAVSEPPTARAAPFVRVPTSARRRRVTRGTLYK